jgi:hypothetical protein
MWAAGILKRRGHADEAAMIYLVALQRSVEIRANKDAVAVLREMEPLIGEVSAITREHPGIRRAAELIAQLGPDE